MAIACALAAALSRAACAGGVCNLCTAGGNAIGWNGVFLSEVARRAPRTGRRGNGWQPFRDVRRLRGVCSCFGLLNARRQLRRLLCCGRRAVRAAVILAGSAGARAARRYEAAAR